METYDALLNFA